MSDDLLQRLRDKYTSPQDVAEAADRIEQLEAALKEVLAELNSPEDDFPLSFGVMRMIILSALEGNDAHS